MERAARVSPLRALDSKILADLTLISRSSIGIDQILIIVIDTSDPGGSWPTDHLVAMWRVQSSRRLEREAQRNTELMWLTGRLAPDFKTIADFRKDNGVAIRAVCARFVVLCRELGLFTRAVVAIDGSKFKAVNNRDKNYTVAKVTGRMEQAVSGRTRPASLADRSRRPIDGY